MGIEVINDSQSDSLSDQFQLPSTLKAEQPRPAPELLSSNAAIAAPRLDIAPAHADARFAGLDNGTRPPAGNRLQADGIAAGDTSCLATDLRPTCATNLASVANGASFAV